MVKFLTGLACAFVGFIIWFLLSVVFGVVAGVEGRETTTGEKVALAFLFFLMVGGPLLFWIVLPIKSRVRRRKRN